MIKRLLILVVIFIFWHNSYAQSSVSISGTVLDTTQGKFLDKTVAAVARFNDSTLVAFARTDKNGFFKFEKLPIDTYQVILSHPLFSDQLFFVFASEKNKIFDFGKITLPAKSVSLNEVVVVGYADPVYYKGDTLIYTADSFKVKANANVEDLLRKLPGIKVDGAGKVYSQGKAVDQVLVDGDEFFGTDPTMATRNLNATTIETVQVYEKKNENTGNDNANETIQVMNLKLKEDAKKGYFGKVSGASDFQKFYESELLANRFSNKQKVSIFGLGSNTPRSNFDWEDAHKYGLTNEMGSWSDGDEETYYFSNQDNSNEGLPTNIKTGFYYNDKPTKKTKLGLNYTFINREVKTFKDVGTSYYLTDTTYRTQENNDNIAKTESNAINLTLNQDIDSLTKIDLTTKFKFVTTNNSTKRITSFYSEDNDITRQTDVGNSVLSDNYDLSNTIKVTRNYKKKDRRTTVNYYYTYIDNASEGYLNSIDHLFDFNNQTSSVDQKKRNTSNNQSHTINATHVEPLTLKFKIELSYEYTYFKGLQKRKTLDYVNGDYSLENVFLSNDFENKRDKNRASVKFIYETKKTRIAIGSRAQQISVANINLISGQKISQTVNQILPNFNYRYKFSDNKRLNFKYNTSFSPPDLNKLQPVPDNTNPNVITLGNPNLVPSFGHNFGITYNTYKPITGSYFWSSVDYTITNNAFGTSVVYDSIGRTYTQTVNVNGNSNLYGNISLGIPLFSKLIQLDPSLRFHNSHRNNYINNAKNSTVETGIGGGLGIEFRKDKLYMRLATDLDYNNPKSTVSSQSNSPYNSANYSFELEWKLPKKFILSGNSNYYVNSRRAQGYNIDYLICNASLSKLFLKNENLIVSLDATDILNQNISASRNVNDNYISDEITNAVGRYILLKVLYKFNSQKTKEEDGF